MIFEQEHLVAPPENWKEMNDFGFPMLFYGVKGQQMREGESPSYFNAGNWYLHIFIVFILWDMALLELVLSGRNGACLWAWSVQWVYVFNCCIWLAVETAKVADLIAGLLEKTNVRMKDIGVMAPFRRQVRTPIS